MPEIDVLVPYATKNYILNPSFENSTDGWNAVGSVVSAVLTRARFERKALQVVTNGAGQNEGTYYRINDISLKGVIFGSLYVRGAGKLRLRLISGGNQSTSKSFDIHDNSWQRVWVQGIANGLNDTRIYIETAETTQSVTFYIDGVQVERTDYLTTYCDGSQDDCRWNGVSHASTSERDGDTPNGGRWVNMRDDECDPTTYITGFSGLGLPPITINRQRMALSPGSFFDSERVEERVLQLAVNIKDNYAQRRNGTSKLRLNALRQHLIDLVKPDRDDNTEPMWIRYREGDRSLMIRVLYESGLEFEGDFRNKWVNSIPLRFLALDPFWYEDSQEVAILDTETAFPQVCNVIARIDGEWQLPNHTPGNSGSTVWTIAPDQNEVLYFGGDFTTRCTKPFTPAFQMRRFSSLTSDYGEMYEVLTGLNGDVYYIKAHPNGKIYAVGDFTGDNAGNTYNRIVEYDPVANTFSALGTGLDNAAFDVYIASNGDVYVAGNFDNAGGNPADGVARWDGGSWHAVGDIGLDFSTATVLMRSIIFFSDTEIYASGRVTNDSVPLIKYDGSTWSEVGNSSSLVAAGDTDNYIVKDNNGNLIFTTDSGYAYRWNGSSFEQLGSQFLDESNNSVQVWRAFVADDGRIYVAGDGIYKNGNIIISSGIAVWNGSTWFSLDIEFFTTSLPRRVPAIYVNKNGDIWIGRRYFGDQVQSSGITYVEVKSTAITYPIVTFNNSQTLVWLENQTSEQQVFMQYTLQSNEQVELDFRIGEKTVKSNYRGSVPDAILPASSDFFLSPSDIDGNKLNKIACFTRNEVSPIAQLRYQPTHWSVDAISKQ